MSIQSNVPSRISKPRATNNGTTRKDGTRCHDTSCTCGRARRAGHPAAPMGQAVVTDLFIITKQDQAKYNLYIFVAKLLRLYGAKVN